MEINVRVGKAWTAINRLSIMWKTNFSHEIKQEFFQDGAVSVLLYGCIT